MLLFLWMCCVCLLSLDKAIMDGHMMRVFAVKFQHTNDSVLVSGGWDNTLQVICQLMSMHALSTRTCCSSLHVVLLHYNHKYHTCIAVCCAISLQQSAVPYLINSLLCHTSKIVCCGSLEWKCIHRQDILQQVWFPKKKQRHPFELQSNLTPLWAVSHWPASKLE